MAEINFTPFPQLGTKNFLLRQLLDSDDQNIFILRSDERVLKYLGKARAESIDEARAFISKISKGITVNEWIYWVVTNNKVEFLGTICLWNLSEDKKRADIGFELLPEHFGRGIMQEVIPTILDYGFNTMQLNAIDGDVDPGNIKSIKLMEKFEFVYSRKLDKTDIYVLECEKYFKLL